MKKILVVYYSRTGNNEILAQEISNLLECDKERIYPYKKYSTVFSIVLSSIFKNNKKIKDIKSDLSSYEYIVICSPVWMGFVPNPVRSFVEIYNEKLNNVFFAAIDGGAVGDNPYVDEYFNSVLGKKFIKSLQLPIANVMPEANITNIIKFKISREMLLDKYNSKINDFVELIKNKYDTSC